MRLVILSLLINGIAFGQIDHWETAVFETDTWNYLVPTAPVNSNWNTVGFNTAGWSSGPAGFGYGDGDDNTVLPNGTISCFHRIEFSITDTSEIDAAALTIDYDDGFVAYLNGVEIARDLLTATGQPSWNDLASGLHEASIYQSIYPAQYTINKAFLTANMVNGINCLAVQVHNESGTSSDLSSRPFLHLGINTTSNNYSPAPGWFVPPTIFQESNLPIIIINTVNGVTIPDEPKVAGTMGIINNGSGLLNNVADPYNEFYGYIGIERRGSSSGGFAKKAYGLETRQADSTNYNASIFDWPADNDWILYAPYSDKSLIRNVLTYKLGREMGRYAPRTQLCEVVLNGEYIGVYVFTERIKQNPGRVNVDELKYTDTSNVDITGGYIVKIDKTTAGGINAWTSPYPQAPPATGPTSYQLHDPDLDTINPLQLNYIQTYITDFETALQGPNFSDPTLGYEPFIDVGSFIDFMLVNELSKNVDGYRISTFYHKQKMNQGGKFHAGPLWDFNLAWGNANYCNGGLTNGWEIEFNNVCGGGGALNNPFHWTRLVQDPDYTYALNCRWQELRMTTFHEDSLLDYIDETALYLQDAAQRNFTKWPVLGTYLWPNNFVGNTYQEEIDYLKTWISDRLTWMDANMFGSCPNLSVKEDDFVLYSIYPNPTQNTINLQFNRALDNGRIQVTDITGNEILTIKCSNILSTSLDLSGFSNGIYLLQLYNNDIQIGNEKIIKN